MSNEAWIDRVRRSIDRQASDLPAWFREQHPAFRELRRLEERRESQREARPAGEPSDRPSPRR